MNGDDIFALVGYFVIALLGLWVTGKGRTDKSMMALGHLIVLVAVILTLLRFL